MATAALLLGLLGSTVLAPTANAFEKPIDITSYTIADQVIAAPACHVVPVSFAQEKRQNLAETLRIEHWITRPDISWRENYLHSDDTKDIDSLGLDCHDQPNTASVPLFPGKYGVGGAHIEVFFYTGASDDDGRPEKRAYEYVDLTLKEFYVRGASLATLSATRSGKNVAITMTAATYDFDGSRAAGEPRYGTYNPTHAVLQVKAGGSWKTLKTVSLSRGKASATISSSSAVAEQYRFTFPQTNTATSATATVTTPGYTGPGAMSPFIDVSPGREHYEHIVWMKEAGISTGWATSAGVEYRPLAPVNRDAMAAFLYRQAGSPKVSLPEKSPFLDVRAGQEH